MTPRHLILGAGLLAAAALVFLGDSAGGDDIAQALPRRGMPARAAASAPDVQVAALVPRERLIGAMREGGDSAALFGTQSWVPPPPPPAKETGKPLPPPPPSAPPLPFSYIGRQGEDGRWEVFVARGDKTYIVKEQSVVDGIYRVDAITPSSITFTYLPLSQAQVLGFGGRE